MLLAVSAVDKGFVEQCILTAAPAQQDRPLRPRPPTTRDTQWWFDALQEGTLDAREAARIGLEVLGALEAAHAAGILHRDVKPDNVLLGRHDRVVLTDFGIAQIEGETSLTDTGGFVGSPEFIAPERVLGQRPGPASDLWSLGVVLYAATEGVSPFRRSNTPATLQSVLNATPAPPASASGPLAEPNPDRAGRERSMVVPSPTSPSAHP